jgi:beta-galactosidase
LSGSPEGNNPLFVSLAQESKQPIIKIQADWQPGAATRDVVVFTNCSSATLSVNGKPIAIGYPQRGKSTAYDKAKPFDGSNTANLKHPPIIFRRVPFAAGVLTVTGKTTSGTVATDALYTSGSPIGLEVRVDTLGVEPRENDLVFVRASIVDAKGHLCRNSDRMVHFSISGPAALAGESDVKSEMGVASALIRVTKGLRGVKVSASMSKN